MTPDPCRQLQPFADGMLSEEQAQAFGQHLADCPRCQSELTGLLQLEELGRLYVEKHGPVKVPGHAVAFPRWKVVGGMMAAAAALVVLFLVANPHRSSPAPALALWTTGPRRLEARVTYPAADRHRPLVSTAMGAQETLSPSTHSSSLTAKLEQQEDLQQLAAVYLATGEPYPPGALNVLNRMRSEGRGQAVDVLCDLGVAHYIAGEDWKALDLFDQVLRSEPTHVQALWNRALVYRRVSLPLLARAGFEAVERADKDEGWRQEAREQLRRLDAVTQREQRWRDAERAGEALISGGKAALEQALSFSDMPMMRRDFYDAVRTRASAEDIRALLPLAQRLDGQAGGGKVLANHVDRVASRNSSQRAPWAQSYARLLSGQLGPEELQTLLPQVLASGEEDIALGFLVWTRAAHPEFTEELIQRTHASTDPWFQLLSLQIQAERDMAKDEYEGAAKHLEDALGRCLNERLFYRCIDIENDLAHVTAWLFQVSASERHAAEGLRMARQTSQWDKECALLQSLGNVARLAANVTQGRAYYGEALIAAGTDTKARRNIHQNLAHLAIYALELGEARLELDRAMDTGLPLTLHGIEALVDVARTRPSPRDAVEFERSLSRERPSTDGQRAYLTFLRGRFTVDKDPQRGRELLEQSIREAEGARSGIIKARHARTYSYTSLIFADVRQGADASALNQFGEELDFQTPSRCVLGVTEDTERSFLIARGANGQLLREYHPLRRNPFPEDLTGIVPPEMVAALRTCRSVDVLARPPLQGRAGLLPPDIAWNYRTRATIPRSSGHHTPHLVVNNVQYDEREAPPLRWEPDPGRAAQVEFLQGLNATPSRVLASMRYAQEIDLATHGKNIPKFNLSYLLLARDVDGSDKLHPEQIRHARLLGSPLVILAACESARNSSALHEADSLPNAFLEAGARGVIAATQKIPDEESSRFFGEVRERVREGVIPSIAVRDVRKQWMDKKQGADWLNGILVFE